MNYKLFLSSMLLSMRWVHSKYLMNTGGLVLNPNLPEKGSHFFFNLTNNNKTKTLHSFKSFNLLNN